MVVISSNKKTLNGLSTDSFNELDIDTLSVEGDITCSSLTASSKVTTSSLFVAGNTTTSGTLQAGSTNLDSCNVSGSLTAGATTLTSCNVSGTLSAGTTTLQSTTCSSLTVSGTANMSSALNLYGTTTIYRPLSSVSTVTFTGTTSVNTLNSSGTIGCNSLNVSGTANITTLNVSGVSTLQTVNVSSSLVSPSLTCTTFNCSGTGTLRNLSISNTSATDEVLISNPNKHPTITLQGTSGQFGYIGFSDYLGATKGSVYASSSKNGVVVDVGSLTSGFLVQKSGSTQVSIDPSGQIVGNNNISIGSGKLSSITHVLGEGSSISTTQAKFGNSSLALTRSNRSFLTIKDLSSASLSTAWTLEFFFYAQDTSGGILMSLPSDGIFQIQHTSASTSNYIYINLKNTSATIISVANTGFSLNTWHHLAIQKSSSNYLCFLNGSLFSNTSSSTVFGWDSLSTALTLGAIYKWSLTNATYSSPAYNTQWRGYIDEFRISSTARYTTSGFTVPTSAFSNDASTYYLNHFDSSILEATEDDSLVTTRGGFIADISGNVACSSLSIQSGNIQTNGGDLIATNGAVQSGGAFLTTDAKLLIAPKSLVTASFPLDPTVGYGAYCITSGGWSQARSSHTIFAQDYLLGVGNSAGSNYGNTNAMGTLRVYASNKNSSGVGIAGVLTADLTTVYGSSNVDVRVNRITKYNMSTFSISNSFANILISTDSTCQICWKYDGCI